MNGIGVQTHIRAHNINIKYFAFHVSVVRQEIYTCPGAGHPKILFGLWPKSLPETGSRLIIVPVTYITLTKLKDKIVQLCILYSY